MPPCFLVSYIQEHIGEDIQGIYMCNHRHGCTTLCLEELVLPSSELDPQNEVAPETRFGVTSIKTLVGSGPLQSAPSIDTDEDIWQQISISEHYSSKETIMWNHLSNYVETGNLYISSIHDENGFVVGKVDLMGAA